MKKGKKIWSITLSLFIIAFFATGCSSDNSTINTTVGEMTIKKAEIVDQFAGRTANPGYKILLIIFEAKDGKIKDGFNEAGMNVYLTTSSVSKVDKFVGGIWNRENFLGFVIPESAAGLMLNWPGNDPIPVEIHGQ